MEATRAASVAAAAEGASAASVGLTAAAAAAAAAAAEASAATHRKLNLPGLNSYHLKDGWQKGQKAAPICVGGPPVPRRHRQHHLFRRWLQRWPWPVTLAIVAIREGNELTLVQPGLSYFTPSGPPFAPCLPARD